jgi:hypothetical protein
LIASCQGWITVCDIEIDRPRRCSEVAFTHARKTHGIGSSENIVPIDGPSYREIRSIKISMPESHAWHFVDESYRCTHECRGYIIASHPLGGPHYFSCASADDSDMRGVCGLAVEAISRICGKVGVSSRLPHLFPWTLSSVHCLISESQQDDAVLWLRVSDQTITSRLIAESQTECQSWWRILLPSSTETSRPRWGLSNPTCLCAPCLFDLTAKTNPSSANSAQPFEGILTR